MQDRSLDTVLEVMNGIFSMVFVADFLSGSSPRHPPGAYFFKHFGWADLLASVPLAQFKILRVFRLIRVYRLLRDVGIRTVGRALSKDRAGSSLYILLLMGIFVLEFGSLSMLRVEQGAPGANIRTASDALWYTIVTISTVGYGDQYPVTEAGRIIGAGIIIVGVGIFGTFTGYLANFFLSPKQKEPAPPAEAGDTSTAAVEGLRLRLDESEAKLAESESCSPSQPSERPRRLRLDDILGLGEAGDRALGAAVGEDLDDGADGCGDQCERQCRARRRGDIVVLVVRRLVARGLLPDGVNELDAGIAGKQADSGTEQFDDEVHSS